MKTIARIFVIGVLLFVAVSTQAQRNGFKEITEKRIVFIASRLNLTADESVKFWPLFREFQDEREQLSKKIKIKNGSNHFQKPESEEDYLDAIHFMIQSKTEQVRLMKDYTQKYLEILPAEKVYLLYQLNDEFNKFLLTKLKESGGEPCGKGNQNRE